jgi:Na+/glutamate symporter
MLNHLADAIVATTYSLPLFGGALIGSIILCNIPAFRNWFNSLNR